MAVSVVVSFGRFSYAIDAADSAAPAQRYSAWAQALGVPETGTLLPLDGDDGALVVTLGASPYTAGSTTAMFCCEGGFSPYKTTPTTTSTASYTLTGVDRMYGFGTRAEALMTFHPQNDCQSTGVQFQRAGAVSIFKGRIKRLGQEINRMDFALRVDASGWELVVQPIDVVQPVKLFLGLPQYEMFSQDVAVGAIKAFSFVPSEIPPAPVPTAVRALAYVSSSGAAPAYGGTERRWLSLGRKDHLSGVLGQGIGRVRGRTLDYANPENKPYVCRVRLVRDVDGYQVRELWSDAQGNYDFQWIDELQSYTVLAYYLDHGKRAVVTDGLTLANGKVELMA